MFGKKKTQHIVVAGMGQGGMVAAYYLGQAGFSVDIYEKAEKGMVSHPWTDDMVTKVWARTGVPMPPKEAYSQMNTWFWVTPNGKIKIRFPANGPGNDMSVDRRMLSDHMAALCEGVGCKVHYGKTVKELLLDGDKIVGINVDGKKIKADLVIDALGIDSVLRPQVPAKWEIQAHEADDDLMLGCRTFYKRNEGYIPPVYPDTRSCMYLKHKGGAGISWCNLSPENTMDILIGRLGGLKKDEWAAMTEDLFAKHGDQLTRDVVVEPKWCKIGTRYTLSKLVADGYALVGDSAFMTIPIMGSGLEASMDAGVFLSEAVIANKGKEMSAKALWPYQVKYFQKKGAIFALIDVFKRWVLTIESETADWAFEKIATKSLVEAITDMALKQISVPKGLIIILKQLPFSVAALFTRPATVKEILDTLKAAIHALLVSLKIPKKYSEKAVHDWVEAYEASFPHKPIVNPPIE